MCRTTDFLFQSSNTLNNTGIWSVVELASLYTAPLSAVNGWTTSSQWQLGTHGRFENFRIGPSLSNRIGTADSNSNRIGTADSNSNRISKLRRSLLFTWDVMDMVSGHLVFIPLTHSSCYSPVKNCLTDPPPLWAKDDHQFLCGLKSFNLATN